VIANICLSNGAPPQSYRASPAIWDHTVLAATNQTFIIVYNVVLILA